MGKRGGRPGRGGGEAIWDRLACTDSGRGLSLLLDGFSQKHSFLHEIAHVLGAHKTSPYPDKRFDLIWSIVDRVLVKKESQQCVGLDEGLGGRHDHDTDIDPADFDMDLNEPDEDENDYADDWWFDEAGEQLVMGDA